VSVEGGFALPGLLPLLPGRGGGEGCCGGVTVANTSWASPQKSKSFCGAATACCLPPPPKRSIVAGGAAVVFAAPPLPRKSKRSSVLLVSSPPHSAGEASAVLVAAATIAGVEDVDSGLDPPPHMSSSSPSVLFTLESDAHDATGGAVLLLITGSLALVGPVSLACSRHRLTSMPNVAFVVGARLRG
jgi:hypothetical protein